MVKQTNKRGKVLYACEECGFAYKEKSWAEKCQNWRSKHSSCNMEITKSKKIVNGCRSCEVNS